ncbi:hypothetical protein L2E82_03249 [Cichorium intybus]|uniref:Uncharacterized protein n=1 Tax=Cichorium intybus TaxID=13427 RepID=A0ACB9H4M0_CICIN|nr:hypothetical protein L2E82_03249 [Cichorium intybus]
MHKFIVCVIDFVVGTWIHKRMSRLAIERYKRTFVLSETKHDCFLLETTSESQFTKTNPPTSVAGTRFRFRCSLQCALPYCKRLPLAGLKVYR